jgi:hypothetical protein
MQESTASQKELKRAYKEKRAVAGVFQIKNHRNGKVFLGSSLNIEGPLNAHEFMLSSGSHRNRALQADYKLHGAEAFTFDVLGVVEIKDEPGFNISDELEVLEELWLEELDPVGEKGYNPNRKIRQA